MDNESAPRSYEIENLYSLGGLPENEGDDPLYNYTPKTGQASTDVMVCDDSMRDVLAKSVGRFVVCELLIGTNNTVSREGILSEVGRSYFSLYDEETHATTICDFYSLRLATCYRAGERPKA